jgi:excisionase family DNA binding protein
MDIHGVNTQLYMSPREAAQMLGTRLDAVYSLIWAGRLQAEKQDGRWLVSRTAVAARMKVQGDQKRRRLLGNNGMDAREVDLS